MYNLDLSYLDPDKQEHLRGDNAHDTNEQSEC